jgi:hypothetical protein
VRQIDEVRSGGSYFSQSDLRVHFGLGKATKVNLLEIRWPSGYVEELKNLEVDCVVHVKEGQGIVKVDVFRPRRAAGEGKRSGAVE